MIKTLRVLALLCSASLGTGALASECGSHMTIQTGADGFIETVRPFVDLTKVDRKTHDMPIYVGRMFEEFGLYDHAKGCGFVNESVAESEYIASMLALNGLASEMSFNQFVAKVNERRGRLGYPGATITVNGDRQPNMVPAIIEDQPKRVKPTACPWCRPGHAGIKSVTIVTTN